MKWMVDGTAPVKPDLATYAQYLRMKLASTFSDTEAPAVTVAGIEDDYGVLMDTDPYQTSGDRQTVRLANAQGTVPMVAAGAILAGTTVYPAAAGKISATLGGNPIGVALQAASGNNSVIEVYRFNRTYSYKVTAELLAASVDKFIHVADRPFTIKSIKMISSVAGNDAGAVSLDVRKITAAGTALPGDAAGATVIEFLSAAIDLKSVAGTTVAGALSAVAGALNVAAGDKIALNFTGVLTSLVGLVIIEGESL